MVESEILKLYDQYSNMVYRLSISYLRKQQEAEDAVQSVFLKLIDGTAMPLPGKERAFLIQITINHCKDVLRSVWKRRVMPLDDTIVFEQKGDRELYQAVMELPHKYRIAVHLHYYEGYSFDEISQFFKVSPSAISMRVHRARKMLKNKLKEDRL